MVLTLGGGGFTELIPAWQLLSPGSGFPNGRLCTSMTFCGVSVVQNSLPEGVRRFWVPLKYQCHSATRPSAGVGADWDWDMSGTRLECTKRGLGYGAMGLCERARA